MQPPEEFGIESLYRTNSGQNFTLKLDIFTHKGIAPVAFWGPGRQCNHYYVVPTFVAGKGCRQGGPGKGRRRGLPSVFDNFYKFKDRSGISLRRKRGQNINKVVR